MTGTVRTLTAIPWKGAIFVSAVALVAACGSDSSSGASEATEGDASTESDVAEFGPQSAFVYDSEACASAPCPSTPANQCMAGGMWVACIPDDPEACAGQLSEVVAATPVQFVFAEGQRTTADGSVVRHALSYEVVDGQPNECVGWVDADSSGEASAGCTEEAERVRDAVGVAEGTAAAAAIDAMADAGSAVLLLRGVPDPLGPGDVCLLADDRTRTWCISEGGAGRLRRVVVRNGPDVERITINSWFPSRATGLLSAMGAGETDLACDGVDSDCNGLLDDGWLPGSIRDVCGEAGCVGSSVVRCAAGFPVWECLPDEGVACLAALLAKSALPEDAVAMARSTKTDAMGSSARRYQYEISDAQAVSCAGWHVPETGEANAPAESCGLVDAPGVFPPGSPLVAEPGIQALREADPVDGRLFGGPDDSLCISKWESLADARVVCLRPSGEIVGMHSVITPQGANRMWLDSAYESLEWLMPHLGAKQNDPPAPDPP